MKAVTAVETPALLINLDAYESNVKRMQDAVMAMDGVKLRPHAKCHKSSRLGHYQVDAGAVGLCAAKLTELEVLVGGGHKDVLLTNQIVSKEKMRRLAGLLTEERKLGVCVDNEANVLALNEAVKERGARGKLDVYIEVDVGQKRCGVVPGLPCATLAETIIQQCPSLRLRGIQAYSGWNQHIQTLDKRADATAEVVSKVQACLHALQEKDISTKDLIITGGGTGTFTLEGT